MVGSGKNFGVFVDDIIDNFLLDGYNVSFLEYDIMFKICIFDFNFFGNIVIGIDEVVF